MHYHQSSSRSGAFKNGRITRNEAQNGRRLRPGLHPFARKWRPIFKREFTTTTNTKLKIRLKML